MKPLVTDELWAMVGPLVPHRRPQPKGGRPWVDDRATLNGILYVLRSGIPWRMLPPELGYKAHEDHVAIQKLRRNKPLTPTDLEELERMFVEAGVGAAEDVAQAAAESKGLGLFVRSLVGLDREAAKEALGAFLDGQTHRANQIQFATEVVDYLTEHGTMPVERLYEAPFTSYHPLGVEGVFPSAEVDQLIATLEDVRLRATA
jgi:type I restriction enzyme R subunit